MKTLDQRINNIIGQLEAIKKMTAEEQDCFKILIQMKAAKSGFSTIMKIFIEEQLGKCITDSMTKTEKEKMQQLLAEVLKD
ncbi:MAG: metal-sensitive transcriptional regulator [Patescibacteria group bacterium]